MKSLLLAATAALALAAALPAGAAVIYQNSTVVGAVTGSNIDGATAVADSFTAAAGSVATSVDFLSFVYYQDGTPTSVDWAISNGDPFAGGTIFAHGTAVPVNTLLVPDVRFGLYNIYDSVFSIGSVALTGGDYWLTLSHGTTVGGHQPLAWDMNGGPSLSFQSVPGAPAEIRTDSHAFSILGTVGDVAPAGGGATAAVPEPAAWALMLAGFGGIGAALRRRREVLALAA
jgi:hypothetical protein